MIAALPDGTEESLDELRELLRTAGVAAVGELVQRREQPHPNTYLGSGKLDEVKAAIAASDANLVGLRRRAHPPSGAQPGAGARGPGDRPHGDHPRHLRRPRPQRRGQAPGRARPAPVQPRPHARPVVAPRAARRRHRHPRTGRDPDRDRPPAGPQPDRRAQAPARSRSVQPRRDAGRARARRMPTVALAGYTNAGKSTLLNALTGAEVGVRDRLFHTLDPTTRVLRTAAGELLLTDTVGFIRKLPHQLVEAFGATLQETRLADLLLHVVDASADEEELGEMIRAVDDVLHEIDADEAPRMLVLGKIDLVDEERRHELRHRHPDAVLVSAVTGEGLDALVEPDRGRVPAHAPGGRAADPLRGRPPAGRAPRPRRRARARGPPGRGPRPRARPGHRRRALRGVHAGVTPG